LIDLDGMEKMSSFFYTIKKAHERDVHRFLENWNGKPELIKYFNRLK
jgi:hypothetical protein